MGRFARSWRLMRASWQLLKQGKRLVVFPLISGAVLALVIVVFVAPMFATGDMQRYFQDPSHPARQWYVTLFVFYLVSYCVMIFFTSALIACVLKQMDGEQPTVRDGFDAAWQRLPQIFGWALLASTVGFALRLLEQRVGFIGRIVIGLLGMAWTVTAFLVVPVLVAEGDGPIDSCKRSVVMLNRTWGEQIIGNVSFGLIFMVLGVAPAIIGILLAAAAGPAVLVTLGAIVVMYLVALGLVQSTLQTIYQAAVYRYATDGEAPRGFDKGLIADAFRVKQSKSWT